MKVYLRSKQDWIDFVNGKIIVAHRNKIENYFKVILVASIEVINLELNTVTIIKKY